MSVGSLAHHLTNRARIHALSAQKTGHRLYDSTAWRIVERHESYGRRLVAQALPGEPTDDDVTLAVVVVDGLWHAVCAGHAPLPVAQARRLLDRAGTGYLRTTDSAAARSSATIRSGSSAE